MSELSKDQIIKQLQNEISQREADITLYRGELVKVNSRLSKLIMELNKDINAVSILHRALVPTEFPNISGFEFSTKFIPSGNAGGDYLDIFDHSDKMRFGVMASSSSGYRVSSLIMSILLELTGTLDAKRGADPHKVIGLVKDELLKNMEACERADIFYSFIDRRSFTLKFCLLGDITAFVQNYSTGELTLLEPSYSPLTSEFNEKLKSNSVSLNANDRLIICTKGVDQAKNLQGESFGKERLMAAIYSSPKEGVHGIRNHILFEIEQFRQGCSFDRDLTIVVAEVKDKIIKLA